MCQAQGATVSSETTGQHFSESRMDCQLPTLVDAGGYVQSQLALRKVWCQPLASASCVHAEHRSQESSSPAGGVKGFVSDTYCAHVVHLVAGTVALAYMASASGTGGQSSRALSPPPLMSTPRPQLPAE